MLVTVITAAQGKNILPFIPASNIVTRSFCWGELVTSYRRPLQQAEKAMVILRCGLGCQGGEEILSYTFCLVTSLIHRGRMGEKVIPKGWSEAVCIQMQVSNAFEPYRCKGDC